MSSVQKAKTVIALFRGINVGGNHILPMKSLHFFFLESKPCNPELEKLSELKTESEKFELIDCVFYLYAPEGIARSKLAAQVEKCVGVPTTARNWNTVSKLLSMASDLQAK